MLPELSGWSPSQTLAVPTSVHFDFDVHVVLSFGVVVATAVVVVVVFMHIDFTGRIVAARVGNNICTVEIESC